MSADYFSSDPVVANAESSKTLSQVESFLCPEPVHAQIEQAEMDVKSLQFDDLIEKLSAKILLEYLLAVIKFLKSSDDELELPDISMELEEVLVRIVKDVNVLRSPSMYSTCEQASNELIEMVKSKLENKDFMLTCTYKQEPPNPLLRGLGVECADCTLVYKKLYYVTATEKWSSMSSPSSTPPLSTRVDSPDSKRSIITLPSEMHFKSHCLHLILQFVKDDTRPSLEFSGLTPDEAKYVYTAFSRITAKKFDASFGDRNICVAIWEAVKIFALKYIFRIRYLESSGETKSLLLEKINKNTILQLSDKTKNSLLLENINNEDISEPKDEITNAPKQPQPKLQQRLKKSVQRQKDFIAKLDSDFIDNSLQELVKFMSDDTERGLVFETMCKNERRFLQNAITYSQIAAHKNIFPENQKKLLEELMVLVEEKAGYKIQSNTKKDLSGITVLFTKVPKFGKPAPNTRPWYPQERLQAPKWKGTRNARGPETYAYSWAEEYSKKALRRAESRAAYKARIQLGQNSKLGGVLKNAESSETEESERDPALVEAMAKYEQTLKDFQPPPPAKTISLGTLGSQVKVPSLGSGSQGGNRKRTEQLMEALSVPVKCDKAMKMMLSMGWNGGPLGSRGQGITEPLMPLIRRQGLGLGIGKARQLPPVVTVPQPSLVPNAPQPSPVSLAPQACPAPQVTTKSKKKKRTRAEFWRMILEYLLELLTSESDNKVVDFEPTMKKKEKQCLKEILKLFAARNSVGVCLKEDQELANKVLAKYMRDEKLVVTAYVDEKRRQLTLTKESCDVFPEQLIKTAENNNHIATLENPKLLVKSGSSLNQSGHKCHAIDTYMEFRSNILLEILNFVKDENKNALEMHFKEKLTVNQRIFIRVALESANNNSTNNTNFEITSPEVMLSTEIQRLMGAFKLHVTFGGERYFKITKEYNKIEEQVTASDDAIPKPTDEIEENNNEANKNDAKNKDVNIKNEETFKDLDVKDENYSKNCDETDINMTEEGELTEKCENIIKENHDDIGQPSNENITNPVASVVDNISEDRESISKATRPKKTKMMDEEGEAMNNLLSTPSNDDSSDTDNEIDPESTNCDYKSIISTSENSDYTTNLDYDSEEDNIEDISMLDSKLNDGVEGQNVPLKLKCDNNLVLSLKAPTMLNSKTHSLGSGPQGGARKRTKQLMEALSVPVKCDKAMRMMLSMGWDGGPLGSRGQGITEPLMPHIRRQGLGLGIGKALQLPSVVIAPQPSLVPNAPQPSLVPNAPQPSLVPNAPQPSLVPNAPQPPQASPAPQATPASKATSKPKKKKRTRAQFRRMVLEYLLELLTSKSDTKVVDFEPTMKKKERRCLKEILKLFATRDSVGVFLKEEQGLANKVLAKYMRDEKLVVTAYVADKRRQLTLTKERCDVFPEQLIKTAENNNHVAALENVKLMVNNGPSSNQLQHKCHPIDTYIKFRSNILLEILNFVKDESKNEFEMHFKTKLPLNRKEFIHLGLESANNNTQFGITSPEVLLSTEIQRLMGPFKLHVTFGNRYFIITKEYNKNEEQDTASDVAVPKPADEIEENNKEVNIKNEETYKDLDVKDEVDNKNCDETDKNMTEETKIIEKGENIIKENHDEIGQPSNENITKPVASEADDISEDSESISKATRPKKTKMMDEEGEAMNNLLSTPNNDDSSDTDNEIDPESTNYDYESIISTSDNSDYTINLDYNETDEDIGDISMRDSELNDGVEGQNVPLKLKCDNNLDLSLKTVTMLNIELKDKSMRC